MFANLPDQLILFRSTQAINAHGASRRAVAFENDELEVWTAQSHRAQELGWAEAYVLRFYGNADRAERWVATEAEMWNDRAIEVWGMNYPGFGGSTGPARLKRIAPAAVTAFDALQAYADRQATVASAATSGKFSKDALRTQDAGVRGIRDGNPLAHSTAPIVIFGTSIGTAPALHIAAHRTVAGLILHNPPALRQLILRQYGWWNLWLLAGPVAAQIPSDLDSIASARAVHAPAIFLLAENDEIVAPRFQQMVVDAYAGEKRVIHLQGAYHNSPVEGAGLADLYKALDWLLPQSSAQK